MPAHLLHFAGSRAKAQREELTFLSSDSVNSGPALTLGSSAYACPGKESAPCPASHGGQTTPSSGKGYIAFIVCRFAGSTKDSHTKALSEVGTRPGEQTEFIFPESQARGALRNRTVRFSKQFFASDFYPGTKPALKGSLWNLSQLLSMD